MRLGRDDVRLRVFCAAVLVFSTSGCSAFSMESLEPVNDPMTPRLLPLVVGLGERNVFRAEELKAVTTETEFATLFRRDLEANVFQADDDRWGYAELRLTFDKDRTTTSGVALAGLNIVTLFVPALLGAPLSVSERTLQAEIAIYDSRQIEVANYVVVGKARYSEGAYRKETDRQAGIDALNNILREFRRLLVADVESINRRLREVGAIRTVVEP